MQRGENIQLAQVTKIIKCDGLWQCIALLSCIAALHAYFAATQRALGKPHMTPSSETAGKRESKVIRLGRYAIVEDSIDYNEAGDAQSGQCNRRLVKYRVTLGNKTVFSQTVSQEGDRFAFADPRLASFESRDMKLETEPAAVDMNGDGTPEIVVLHIWGGAHAVSSCKIISLGKDAVDVLLSAELGNGGDIQFVHSRGKYLVTLCDIIYYGWVTGDPDSPLPKVVCCYRGGKFRACKEHMMQPTPTQSSIDNLCAKLILALKKDRASPDQPIIGETLGPILDLIYSGHAELARKVFSRVYARASRLAILTESGEKLVSKNVFWEMLVKKVTTSPYYTAIKAANHGNI